MFGRQFCHQSDYNTLEVEIICETIHNILYTLSADYDLNPEYTIICILN